MVLIPSFVYGYGDSITGINVKSSRWPDSYNLNTWASDSCAIMGATTNQQKAEAVFRYLQSASVVVGPVPKSANYGITDVVSPDMLLNVFGAHYCDGLTQTLVGLWRSLGYKAKKEYEHGHTMADLNYIDEDLVNRWHLLDSSGNHWFVYNRDGSHIATKEETALDRSLTKRPASPFTKEAGGAIPGAPEWIYAVNQPLVTQWTGMSEPYNRAWSLKKNESATLYFANTTKKPKFVFNGDNIYWFPTDFVHGPYPKGWGSGKWSLTPDFDTSDWQNNLYAAPTNITTSGSPKVHPSATGVTSSFIYYWKFPYVIADIEVSLSGKRTNVGDILKIYVSRNGTDWVEKWAASTTGTITLTDQSLVVDYKGTATSGDGGPSSTVLIDSGASFSSVTNAYDYAILRNDTTGKSCNVDEYTSTTITPYGPTTIEGSAYGGLRWTAGNSYSVIKSPASTTPAFGRFDYYLKIEMRSDVSTTDVGLDSLTINNFVQLNFYSLPQLWPVYNTITASGTIASDTTLKVTYDWNDLIGNNRLNVVEVEDSPYAYQVRADGTAWSSVRVNSIKIEAIPRVGSGNRMTTQESAPTHTTDITPQSQFQTYQIAEQSSYTPAALKTAAQYRTDIVNALATGTPAAYYHATTGVEQALIGLQVLRDNTPETIASIESVLTAEYCYHTGGKTLALQALYLTEGASANVISWCEKVLNRDSSIPFKDFSDPVNNGQLSSNSLWIYWANLAAQILMDINTESVWNLKSYFKTILDYPFTSTGYFVIRNENNTWTGLTSDQGGPSSITISNGTYTGAQLATVVQNALNANTTLTGSGTINFTVDYGVYYVTYFRVRAGTGHWINYTYDGSQLARDLGWNDDSGNGTNPDMNGLDNTRPYRWVGEVEDRQVPFIRALGLFGEALGGCTEGEISTLYNIRTNVTGYQTWDGQGLAAEALGRCGNDSVVPSLVTLFNSGITYGGVYRIVSQYAMEAIGKLGNSSNAPAFYSYVSDWDEDFRGLAAEALGRLGNIDACGYLTSQKIVETYSWVISNITAAETLLACSGISPRKFFGIQSGGATFR